MYEYEYVFVLRAAFYRDRGASADLTSKEHEVGAAGGMLPIEAVGVWGVPEVWRQLEWMQELHI